MGKRGSSEPKCEIADDYDQSPPRKHPSSNLDPVQGGTLKLSDQQQSQTSQSSQSLISQSQQLFSPQNPPISTPQTLNLQQQQHQFTLPSSHQQQARIFKADGSPADNRTKIEDLHPESQKIFFQALASQLQQALSTQNPPIPFPQTLNWQQQQQQQFFPSPNPPFPPSSHQQQAGFFKRDGSPADCSTEVKDLHPDSLIQALSFLSPQLSPQNPPISTLQRLNWLQDPSIPTPQTLNWQQQQQFALPSSHQKQDPHPESQKIIERIKQHKYNFLSVQCRQLYDPSTDSFGLAAVRISKELREGIQEKAKIEVQKLMPVVRDMMQNLEAALNSFWRNWGLPELPVPFLQNTVDRLENELCEYCRWIDEQEQLISIDACGPSSIPPSLLQVKPNVMPQDVYDSVVHLSAKVEKLHENIQFFRGNFNTPSALSSPCSSPSDQTMTMDLELASISEFGSTPSPATYGGAPPSFASSSAVGSSEPSSTGLDVLEEKPSPTPED